MGGGQKAGTRNCASCCYLEKLAGSTQAHPCAYTDVHALAVKQVSQVGARALRRGGGRIGGGAGGGTVCPGTRGGLPDALAALLQSCGSVSEQQRGWRMSATDPSTLQSPAKAGQPLPAAARRRPLPWAFCRLRQPHAQQSASCVPPWHWERPLSGPSKAEGARFATTRAGWSTRAAAARLNCSRPALSPACRLQSARTRPSWPRQP